MLTELLIAAAVGLTLGILSGLIEGLLERWGQQSLPQTSRAELSEADQKKVVETQALICRCFGGSPVECLKNASNKDRIALVAEFSEQLAELYGLDIEVDVTVNELKNCGSYYWKEHKAVFNIALLMVDGSNEHFDFCVRETLDTIIHELRHAVQHRAVREPGFWSVDEERRLAWAENMTPDHYISPAVNLRAYAEQPIEKDAVTFAAAVMEGVLGV